MNAEQLLHHFDQIADEPDAVARLRRFILDLAVRGKLVPQNPNEEPASELLKQIKKLRLIETGKNLVVTSLSAVNNIDTPFLLPNTWQWVRIGDIFNYDSGRKTEPNQLPPDAWLLELEDIEKDSGKLIQRFTVDARSPKSTKSGFLANDVLYGKLRPYLNKAVVANCPGYSTTEIVAVRCYGESNPYYTCLALRRPDFVEYVTRLGQGTKMPRLRTEDALSALFPLPPLAEQHRIVAKVDELMALCDELEGARAQRETRRDQLVAATLHSLANDPVGHAGDVTKGPDVTNGFAERARFYFNHLPRLTVRPEHIKQLQQTILNLAVRGKLVPQDPNDEPIATLLRKVDEERALVARKDRRADLEIQELLADELCWEVPPTWRWRGIADLALFIDYRGQTPPKVDSGIRLITAKNVRPGFIKLDPEEFVTESTYKTWMTRGIPSKGDVLFTTEAPMGNAAVVDLEEKFALAQRTICLRFFGGLNPRFVTLQLRSLLFQEILDFTATGLTAKGIKAAKLKRLPLVVPPLAEQHRIVAKVDKLMALCDALEAQLTNNADTRRQLLEATLYTALAGQHEAEISL